ncbi:hypothetical protein FSP39_013235 [Pinctada imbricata]|uniref:Afadin n=1 Tax=Pinctada imbricata TaxID=66713 RepID=A0AA88XS31_PINIB|nr:hypothetical protein FSP39_013235 [Pinctada imbricata]
MYVSRGPSKISPSTRRGLTKPLDNLENRDTEKQVGPLIMSSPKPIFNHNQNHMNGKRMGMQRMNSGSQETSFPQQEELAQYLLEAWNKVNREMDTHKDRTPIVIQRKTAESCSINIVGWPCEKNDEKLTSRLKMTDFHWKRTTSVPVSLEFLENSRRGKIDLESSLPLFLEEQSIRRAIIYPGKKQKPSVSDETCATTDLSYDQCSPGVLKIFGDTLVPGVEYKSVLASYRSTARELVKQALERYGLSQNVHHDFVLCDVVGKCNSNGTVNVTSTESRTQKWSVVCCRVVADTDRPLQLQSFWKPADGFSRRYELRRKSEISAETSSEDDTSGLNENARKISIAKLRPGAIPFFPEWQNNKKLEKFADELNLEDTLSRRQSQWSAARKNECNKLLNGLNLDIGLSNHNSPPPLPVRSPSRITPPLEHPFLLTLRCYDVASDPLYHTLQFKPTIISNTPEEREPCLVLKSPDISCKYCTLQVKRIPRSSHENDRELYNYFLEISCHTSSNVKINGILCKGRGVLQCGDVLSIGIHYLFMFKDLTTGYDIPHTLPWMPTKNIEELGYHGNIKPGGIPPLALGNIMDDNASTSTSESNSDTALERFRFAYAKDKEEEMLKAIASVIRQNYVDFPLATAYLYSMCIEYTCAQFDPHQIHNLLLRTLVVVRESVSVGLIRSKRSPPLEEDYLKALVRWMSNCVQLVLFLRSRGLRRRVGRRGMDDDVQSAFYDLAAGLEEIVVFCFQQSIYTITKALYVLLPAILDSNPFQDSNGEEKRGGVWKIITIMDSVAKLTNEQHLHTEVTKQLFMYLFFFCSTSLFNRLFQKDAGAMYYNWSAGVRIRANLGEIEDWAVRNGLDEEFGQLFEKLLTAAEFLSTSKTLLLKYDWMVMKSHFHPLNEAQLQRLLSGYHLGGRNVPQAWIPPPEDRHQAHQEEEILLEMAGHPPFLIPQDDGVIDLTQAPDDGDFWAYFKKLHSQYGVIEDDSDSGISPSTTPRLTGIFPRADLQNSFFISQASHSSSQRIKQNHKNSSSSTRKVTFAPMELDSEGSTPRDEPSTSRSFSQDSDNPTPDLMRDHGYGKRRRNNSANERLDQLIANGHDTNSEHKRSNVENIRCTSPLPPPLPPRVSRDCKSQTGVQQSPRSAIKREDVNANVAATSTPINETDTYVSVTKNVFPSVTSSDSNADEDIFPKELLLEVNKQILETQQQRKAFSSSSNSSSSGVTEGCPDLSPRLKSSPAITVEIQKGSNGLGLGLIDGLYTPLRLAGIYIRSVVPGSPADCNGQLGVGDRLLCVNGKSIVGADYQR